MTLQTEFEFTLPKGYVDGSGTLHREGTMRLATARDEIEPLRDPRVQANEAYLTVIILSRVITRLGTVSAINPRVIEGLFASDLAYLQDFYGIVNFGDPSVLQQGADTPLSEPASPTQQSEPPEEDAVVEMPPKKGRRRGTVEEVPAQEA